MMKLNTDEHRDAAKLATLGSAGVPIDPTDPRFVTTAGAIHAAAGILSFTCFALAEPLLTRPVAAVTSTPGLRRLAVIPPIGYLLFWTTGILDNQLGGLLGNRSATGLGERLMAVAFIVWLLAVAASVRRAMARKRLT